MRTYIFYYVDSFDSFFKLDFKDFIVSASTFDIASSRFFSFFRQLDCEYISYGSFYSIVTDGKKRTRSFKDSDLIALSLIKDSHNAKFWRKHDG